MTYIDTQDILTVLRKSKGGLTFSQICKSLDTRGKEKDALKKVLKGMISKKKITYSKDKKYSTARPMTPATDTLIGRLEVHERGFGFCILDDLSPDIFIPRKNIRGAKHLDRVEVEVLKVKSDKKREGRIKKVLEEKDRKWLGVVYPYEGQWLFCPWGRRDPENLHEKDVAQFNLQEDDIIVAKLQSQGKRSKKVIIEEVIGNIENPKIDTPMLIQEFELEQVFSPRAIAQASLEPELDDCAHIRKDLSHLPFVTIDGETAKDFDDAIYMDEKDHLWVAIADVSHYVKPETDLDIEACQRGNSFYFPDQVVPMLPSNLSDVSCSLRPHESKFVMVVEIAFTQDLSPELIQVLPAKIESKARLTYTQVAKMLDGKMDMEDAYKDSLTRLYQKTTLLFKKRIDEGAIDFDMPEIRYVGLEKEPRRVARNKAHQLIEECMLCANQVTSKFMHKHAPESIFRVHEKPDLSKLKDAVTTLETIFKEKDRWEAPEDGHDIQNILLDIKDHPHFTQIQYLFLRAMAQANYATEKLGHFGLGFIYYSHFTSPIRRYADLILHRIIKNILLKKNAALFPRAYGSLTNTCLHISKQDRKSLVIERTMKKIKGVRYMQEEKGNTFQGVISGVLPKGVFVETQPFLIEGFITEETLQKKGYHYQTSSNQFAKKGQSLHYGASLQVKVLEANLFKRLLNFTIAD